MCIHLCVEEMSVTPSELHISNPESILSHTFAFGVGGLNYHQGMCVFMGTWTIREGCECRKTGKVQHSYFRLRKFAKHARGFVSCLRESFFVQWDFFCCWNFLRMFSASREQLMTLPNPRALLANFWSLIY